MPAQEMVPSSSADPRDELVMTSTRRVFVMSMELWPSAVGPCHLWMRWVGAFHGALEFSARLSMIGFNTKNPDNLLIRIARNTPTIRILRGWLESFVMTG